MAYQGKLPFVVPVSHMDAGWSTVTPLSIQLTAYAPEKTVEVGPSCWAPEPMWETQKILTSEQPSSDHAAIRRINL